jgi:hypothetical protein
MGKGKSIPTDNVLPPDVAKEYEVAPGVLSMFADNEFGNVDLTCVNLEFAGRLAEKGYLKKLQETPAP